MQEIAELATDAELSQRADAREGRPRTVREFERALRTLGFSKNEAKTVAARGFNGLADQPPEDEQQQQLVDVLAALRRLEERISKGT